MPFMAFISCALNVVDRLLLAGRDPLRTLDVFPDRVERVVGEAEGAVVFHVQQALHKGVGDLALGIEVRGDGLLQASEIV
jgi:hypothetical protein